MTRTLQSSLAGASLAGLGDLALARPVSDEDAKVDPKVVRFSSDIEPLVQLLEEMPRSRLLEEVGDRVKKGLSYRKLLAALLLAGVRNVEPRPSVGFKFHAVLVVNSAHLASLSGPPSMRWLPIFWALDYFKSSQARDERERGWTMAPVDETKLPSANESVQAFQNAMESWDEGAADAAVAQLARTSGAQQIFEKFFYYGARDFRSIGHKAIFVANSYRTLGCIGWHHAEPVLRSLAYALLMHEGGNPAERDAEADRPWRHNLEFVSTVASRSPLGRDDAGAVAELTKTFREQSWEDAAHAVEGTLQKGVGHQSVWDAVFRAASELVYRKPNILSLHAMTTANALHYAYRSSGNRNTRALILLQAASFLPLFREGTRSRGGGLPDRTLDSLAESSKDAKAGGVETIFEALGDSGEDAARRALAYLNAEPDNRSGRAQELIDFARMLIFTKGRDAHDYKYSSALLEDYFHVSPASRDTFLAASVPLLRAAKERDNGLVERIRDAVGGTAKS